MNSQDITRALIDTTVARAMVEMDADPKRSVRKLCDLGRQFSRGRFQNQIFAIFQDLLRNDESPYYQAIDFLLRSNDPEALRQFGINIGYNAGFDIAYSGTVAAAMEAVMNGIPAIAFSAQHDGSYDVTDRYILDIARELLAAPLAPGEIWNVNFPGCPLDEFKGILHERTIAPKFIFDNTYSANHRSGGMTLIPDADFIAHGDAPAGSDIEAVLHGYISIGKVKSMVL